MSYYPNETPSSDSSTCDAREESAVELDGRPTGRLTVGSEYRRNRPVGSDASEKTVDLPKDLGRQ